MTRAPVAPNAAPQTGYHAPRNGAKFHASKSTASTLTTRKTMDPLDRRAFLKYSTEVTGRTFAGFAALYGLAGRRGLAAAAPRPVAELGDGGYGPLIETGRELALPRGFSYRVIGVEGTPMSDGNVTPPKHDGMCALPLPNGNIRLIRNHEVENNPTPGGVMGDPAVAYDRGAGGGTTSLEVDPESREVVRDFISLNGTWRNCAGGPTPWGSWLTCEEAFYGPESGFGDLHGYVFEVPAAREEPVLGEPIRAMGRFVHEAVAVDPTTGVVYQTEDLFRAGFYRYLPNDPYGPGGAGDLRAGGRLQMLAVRDRPNYETHERQEVGRALPATWVDIDNPDPQGGPEDRQAVFEQGWRAGGARFSRLEGCYYADGNVYLVATDGGEEGMGQVWQYRPAPDGDGDLTLIFESPGQNVLERPDNICVSPRGGIVLCEDGHGRRQMLRGLTPDGKIFDLAKNLSNGSELAGATFSPDGQTLFFNIMGNPDNGWRGMTFAVWGPWQAGSL